MNDGSSAVPSPTPIVIIGDGPSVGRKVEAVP